MLIDLFHFLLYNAGNLNLKRLTGVSGAGNVRSGHMLMAINSLCPALKQLELFSYEASKSRGFLRADKTERFFKNKFTEVSITYCMI
jgi:hypothetical protein